MMEDRIKALVAQFNGAIKYTPMLKDHPDWADDDCLAFARKWHVVAINQLRASLNANYSGGGNWHNPPRGMKTWNDRIPYCRNLPTAAMLAEAMK